MKGYLREMISKQKYTGYWITLDVPKHVDYWGGETPEENDTLREGYEDITLQTISAHYPGATIIINNDCWKFEVDVQSPNDDDWDIQSEVKLLL